MRCSKSAVSLVLAGSVLVTGPAWAQEALLAVLGGVQAGADDGGAVVTIDRATGEATVLDTPMPGFGLVGLAVTSAGKAYAVTNTGGGMFNAKLIEIDPRTGSLVRDVGALKLSGTTTYVQIHDLAAQPGTDVVFGSSTDAAGLLQSTLVTIDPATADVTIVGVPDYGIDTERVSITFSPNGTLWAMEWSTGNIWTVDPATAIVLAAGFISPPNVGTIGLGSLPDGTLVFSECCNFTIGNDVYLLDTGTLNAALLGPAGGTRRVHDFAFFDPAAIFQDGFESGDLSAWSATVP
jgi:DNA-binding beta-propeller fold protein YncE